MSKTELISAKQLWDGIHKRDDDSDDEFTMMEFQDFETMVQRIQANQREMDAGICDDMAKAECIEGRDIDEMPYQNIYGHGILKKAAAVIRGKEEQSPS